MLSRRALSGSIASLVALAFVLPGTLAWSQDKYVILHTFTSFLATPQGALVRDSAGNLYGVTEQGGYGGLPPASSYGGIYELTPSPGGTWSMTILHLFEGSDGRYPMAGLKMDSAGNLYGTTYEGGTTARGTVFQLAPGIGGKWTYADLYSFNGGTDGEYPESNIVLDAAGNLYGTTFQGGRGGKGTVFELSHNTDGTWSETVLKSFTGPDGAYPSAGVTLDGAGNLYGTTAQGGGSGCEGNGCGIVFRLMPASGGSWTETIMHTFTGGADGAVPFSQIGLDGSGNAYGTTYQGGGSGCHGIGCGTVFELTPASGGSWSETIIHNFGAGSQGALPTVGVTLDAMGNLFGTTSSGATAGVVFELVETSGNWDYAILHGFTGYGLGPQQVILDSEGNIYGVTSGGAGNYGLVFEIEP